MPAIQPEANLAIGAAGALTPEQRDRIEAAAFRKLVEHLGQAQAAAQLMQAIERVTANPALHTRDLGGTATTAQVSAAVCELLANPVAPLAA